MNNVVSWQLMNPLADTRPGIASFLGQAHFGLIQIYCGTAKNVGHQGQHKWCNNK